MTILVIMSDARTQIQYLIWLVFILKFPQHDFCQTRLGIGNGLFHAQFLSTVYLVLGVSIALTYGGRDGRTDHARWQYRAIVVYIKSARLFLVMLQTLRFIIERVTEIKQRLFSCTQW